MSEPEHPMQPIIVSKDGRPAHFKENQIIRYLLDTKAIKLDDIFSISLFNQKDVEQFLQLMGYTVGGFLEYECISQETRDKIESLEKEEESS